LEYPVVFSYTEQTGVLRITFTREAVNEDGEMVLSPNTQVMEQEVSSEGCSVATGGFEMI
jgi:hypothetical protein